MNKLRYLLLVVLTSQACLLQAQIDAPEPFIYDPAVLELIATAKKQMSAGDYEQANKTFRKALATNKTLPTEMSYLFAETLFVINQYQNSKNFVDKYLDLAGQGGDYYEKAVQLESMLEERFREIRECDYCNLSGYRYVECDNCGGTGKSVEICYNCKGNGVTTCPKCMGKGVLITYNSLGGRQYESCDLCDSKGYVTCPVCHGEKTLSGVCTVCLGTGKKVSSQICDHKPPH
jgi:tetratricopeptide (TPR) repeat protein